MEETRMMIPSSRERLAEAVEKLEAKVAEEGVTEEDILGQLRNATAVLQEAA